MEPESVPFEFSTLFVVAAVTSGKGRLLQIVLRLVLSCLLHPTRLHLTPGPCPFWEEWQPKGTTVAGQSANMRQCLVNLGLIRPIKRAWRNSPLR